MPRRSQATFATLPNVSAASNAATTTPNYSESDSESFEAYYLEEHIFGVRARARARAGDGGRRPLQMARCGSTFASDATVTCSEAGAAALPTSASARVMLIVAVLALALSAPSSHVEAFSARQPPHADLLGP